MHQNHKTEMARVLDSMSFDGLAVFLFGHCNATEETADYLMARGVNVNAIFDNSASKQGLVYNGVPIVPPDDIRGYTARNSAVLIAARFFAEMSAQLRRLGYDGEITRVINYDSFSEYSLSDEVLERKKKRMLRGADTLERIRARRAGRYLIICPNNALGDVYWAMSFLPAYREKHGITETAVIVTGGGCGQVAEMFGAGNVIALDEAGMDELVQAVLFTRAKDCLIAHHDRPYTDNIIKYLDRHFLSFIDYYKRAVYGLTKDAEPSPPSRVSALADAGSLVRGKTVIIAPYAKSVVRPPDAFWEDIAAQWKSRGYSVRTNVNGAETPIKGTAPLSLPVGQMVSAAEYAGAFVGLRSGMCDVVHTAKCDKTVVYPDCFYSATAHKVERFVALPGWKSLIYRRAF